MARPTADTQNAARASCHVSNLIAKKLKPFSDGEIVKECMDILVETYVPKKVQSLPIYRCFGGQ